MSRQRRLEGADLTPAEVAAAAERRLGAATRAMADLPKRPVADRIAGSADLGPRVQRALYLYRCAQMLVDMHQLGMSQTRYAALIAMNETKVSQMLRAARAAAAEDASSRDGEATADGEDGTGDTVTPGAAAPTSETETIVAHLRGVGGEQDGVEYLTAKGLDRAGLLTVAAAVGLTGVDRIGRGPLILRIVRRAMRLNADHCPT